MDCLYCLSIALHVVFFSIDCIGYVYSYIQLLAASVFIKFTVSVSVSVRETFIESILNNHIQN